MESAAVLRSLYCAVGTTGNVWSSMERPDMVPINNGTLKKSLFFQGLTVSGRIGCSPIKRKGAFLSRVKDSDTTIAPESNVSSDSSSQGTGGKKTMQRATFPNGFEALVSEVCDETDVAELKLKVGDFEMHLKRNIEAAIASSPVISATAPPPLPSKPIVESASVAPAKLPQKSSGETSPFKTISLAKSSKLAALEASGSNAYVLVSSPTVGIFRRGRTLKGKRQPPICKEGDVIKEGQTIGFVDQFGSELPVKSDLAGEVLKLLYNDGEAVGYGDPLVAVLPSFPGININ